MHEDTGKGGGLENTQEEENRQQATRASMFYTERTSNRMSSAKCFAQDCWV